MGAAVKFPASSCALKGDDDDLGAVRSCGRRLRFSDQTTKTAGADMNLQQPICQACSQPIVPPVPDLPPIKRRILEIVRRRPGISAEELRSLVWDDPSSGPECRHTIFVHIS